MKVLILEDDVLLADLIATVVDGLYPGVTVVVAGSVAAALEHWLENGADLMIIDLNLPDGSGLDVVSTVRQSDSDAVIVIISGRSDRDSILKAAHYGISGYISKPFDVLLLHERLVALVKPETFQNRTLPDLDDLLRTSMESVIQLPSAFDTVRIIELFDRRHDLSVSQLAERWNGEVALTTRLLDVANSASLKKTGEPVSNLKNAIATMGVNRALQQALALSLDSSGQLRDGRLFKIAAELLEWTKKVASKAEQIALKVGANPSEAHTAGLLSRLGELAVLKVLQQSQERLGLLADDQIESALETWAQSYGNQLKVQWHLPLQLRELIGAVHFLPRGVTSESKLVMRASALLVDEQSPSEECLRLLRRLGLREMNKERQDG